MLYCRQKNIAFQRRGGSGNKGRGRFARVSSTSLTSKEGSRIGSAGRRHMFTTAPPTSEPLTA
jgi:hypothetical protein